MKLLSFLPLALAASAFVIPETETLESLEVRNQRHIKDLVWTWDEAKQEYLEVAGDLKHKAKDAVEYVHDAVVQYSDDFTTAFAGQAWLDSAKEKFEHPPPHHGPPHHRGPHKPHKPTKSVYELLASSIYHTEFVKVINDFPELVEALNSTSGNFTVFAPNNEAFKHIPKDAPKPPKERVKAVLQYHISPDFYPAGQILVTRTVPTSLNGTFIGGEPQRLSTQLGLFGLTINYYAHIVHVDTFGTNGVVHSLNTFLFPPPKAVDILSLLPGDFSTLELGLYKTELYELFNNTDLHVGGTLFAPTNFAFELLGPRASAFLFSSYGLKYLKALLLYHAVPDITLYSDAIYKAEEESATDIPKDFFHIDLPTGLEDKTISVDAIRFGRLITLKLNGFVIPSALDGIAADGVIHAVPVVLVPPREAGAAGEVWTKDMTLEDLIERLEPYVETDTENIEWELK